MKTILKNDRIEIAILNKGAELCSVQKNQKEFIWNANPKFWTKHSPILFPIVGTLKNNLYHINNFSYNMCRHGFARDLNFDLVSDTADGLLFELNSCAETFQVYPFQFSLQIKYQIKCNELFVTFIIENKNNFDMPFSIGAHPAFSLPNNFTKYSLLFESDDFLKCAVLENDLIGNDSYEISLVKNTLPLKYDLFENDALIFKSLNSRRVTILDDQKPYLTVDFLDFESLGIWTKNDAPFVCIEPWNGYADSVDADGDFYKKEGIKIIGSHETFQCQYSVTFH